MHCSVEKVEKLWLRTTLYFFKAYTVLSPQRFFFIYRYAFSMRKFELF